MIYRLLKTVSFMIVMYLSLLAGGVAVEEAVTSAGSAGEYVAMSDMAGGDGEDETVSKISAAALPVNAVALQRNYSNPDYARIVQRNVKNAIGDIIKGASMYGSLMSERMQLLLDGMPCSIARYCDRYYIIATRHILI